MQLYQPGPIAVIRIGEPCLTQYTRLQAGVESESAGEHGAKAHSAESATSPPPLPQSGEAEETT